MNGPTDFNYVTPEEYFEICKGKTPLAELKRKSGIKGMCEVCGALPVWRLVDLGMCFPCTTGEADASDDYELIAFK